jgi:hypothetical protein
MRPFHWAVGFGMQEIGWVNMGRPTESKSIFKSGNADEKFEDRTKNKRQLTLIMINRLELTITHLRKSRLVSAMKSMHSKVEYNKSSQ